MERTVAETVDVVHLALVDAVFPVNIEEAPDQCCNLVHLVAVESYHADAQDVGKVRKARILACLAYELAREAVFGLDACFERVDIDVVRLDAFAEDVLDHLQKFFVGSVLFAVFLDNCLLAGGEPVIGLLFFHYDLPNTLSTVSANSL